MGLGPHSFFIVSAYLGAAAVVAVLMLWIVVDRRELQRRLAGLEAGSSDARRDGRSDDRQ